MAAGKLEATPADSAMARNGAGDRRCQGQLRPFLDSMGALRKSLAVGLSYREYLRELREVRAAYDGIRAERLEIGCLLAAGTPGERALNRYIEAANTWGDCLSTASCSTESIEPRLQRKWAIASDLLTFAQSGL